MVSPPEDKGLPPWLSQYYQARDPSTPPDVLTVLSKAGDYMVRWWVARNPSTPHESLAILAQDVSYVVRMEVAQNSSAPADVLAALIRDDYWNPSTPYGLWVSDWGRVLP